MSDIDKLNGMLEILESGVAYKIGLVIGCILAIMLLIYYIQQENKKKQSSSDNTKKKKDDVKRRPKLEW